VRKKLVLVAAIPLILAVLTFVLLPTEGQLQTYVTNPSAYGIDNHALMSHALALKARCGNERCLRALIEGGEAIDGGYTVAHGSALKSAREHCDPATYKRVLNQASPTAQHRAGLI